MMAFQIRKFNKVTNLKRYKLISAFPILPGIVFEKKKKNAFHKAIENRHNGNGNKKV